MKTVSRIRNTPPKPGPTGKKKPGRGPMGRNGSMGGSRTTLREVPLSLRSLQERFVLLGEQLADLFGFTGGMGRMIGFLFTSSEPVSLSAMCSCLRLTKGTVSVYLKLLEERRIIRRGWVAYPGREKFFEINPFLLEDVRESILEGIALRVRLVEDAVKAGRQDLDSVPPSGNASEDGKVNSLRERLTVLEAVNHQTAIGIGDLLMSLKARKGESQPVLTRVPIQGDGIGGGG